LLCSCDAKDVDMHNIGFVLLHLTGAQNLDWRSKLVSIPLLVLVDTKYATQGNKNNNNNKINDGMKSSKREISLMYTVNYYYP
jgi:hypothetical protein